jgi:hypothetical protein
MFTSKVLTQYSWTGVSGGLSEGKKSFQILDGVVGVLFEVIYLADNRYTRQKNIPKRCGTERREVEDVPQTKIYPLPQLLYFGQQTYLLIKKSLEKKTIL